MSSSTLRAGGAQAGAGPLGNLGAALTGLPDLERSLMRSLHRTAAPLEFVTLLRAVAAVAGKLGLQVSATM